MATTHQERYGSLSPVRHKEASQDRLVSLPSSARRGIGLWTPLCIIGGTLVAAILAILHYLFDSHLNNHPVSGYWTQTKSGQIEILLSSAFKIMFCFSAGVSLIQVSWRTLRRQPLPLADIDALLSAPSMMTLPRTNLIFQAPLTLFIVISILVSPLITVFAPSLSVRRADPISQTITVPTLDLATDRVLHDFTEQALHYGPVTNTWDRAALLALLSDTPVGWPIPAGCAPECEYNFTYAAPAIRCTDLTPDQIDDGAADGLRFVSRVFQDPPAAYLLGYDIKTTSTGQAALNFTTQDRYHGAGQDLSVPTDQYVWTVAFVPYLASNVDEGALINAAGAVCVFYNATHEAHTHFFNATQEISVSVVEFHDALNTTFKSGAYKLYNQDGGVYTLDGNNTVGVEGVSYAPGIGANVHTFAMVDALNNILSGSISRDANTGVFTPTQTRITETGLFEPLDSFSPGLQYPGLNLSIGVTNFSKALQDLVANATLGFIQFNTGFTTVPASVPTTENVYVFNRTTLGATYLVAFAILLLITVAGVFALITNGEPSANKFSALLATTCNPHLLPVAEAVKADPELTRGVAGSARLMFGAVTMPSGAVEPGFGVAGEGGSVELLRRRR
ncbi:hypothetical protein DFH09DRAFT_1374384 [Mycena vulgaris]|nr:hypothetical protein DFH09DRAFT_1374384 [Mycena vulgaris]